MSVVPRVVERAAAHGPAALRVAAQPALRALPKTVRRPRLRALGVREGHACSRIYISHAVNIFRYLKELGAESISANVDGKILGLGTGGVRGGECLLHALPSALAFHTLVLARKPCRRCDRY